MLASMEDEFQEALHNFDYKTAVTALYSSTKDLENLKTLQPTPLTDVLLQHRYLCDALRDACNFATTFERSFQYREGLLTTRLGKRKSAPDWLVASIRATRAHVLNVSDAAAAVRRLGSSLEGRCTIGAIGGVKALLDAWRTHPRCLAIVESLAVLCGGHVDNISRFVRENGVEHCLDLLADETVYTNMKKEVLLLLGLCAICLPDHGMGENLVAAVVRVLQDAVKQEKKDEKVAREIYVNALCTLGNVADAVCRERYMHKDTDGDIIPGYHVPDPVALSGAVIDVWEQFEKSAEIVSPVALALCSMKRAGYIHSFPKDQAFRIRKLFGSCRIHASDPSSKVCSKTAKALYSEMHSTQLYTRTKSGVNKRKRGGR